MSTHTSGPWSIESPCGHIRAAVPSPDNGNLVNTHIFMQVTDNGTDYDERIANARLIAAAPDGHAANLAMLAALDETYEIKAIHSDEWIYDVLPSSGVARAYFMARAAIAKATQP